MKRVPLEVFGLLLLVSCSTTAQLPPTPSGVDAVNQLLSTRECNGCDLGGMDLSSLDLRGVQLKGADLEGADLEAANLQAANLENANLQGANLRRTNFWYAILAGANLRNADSTDTQANNTTDLTGATMADGTIHP